MPPVRRRSSSPPASTSATSHGQAFTPSNGVPAGVKRPARAPFVDGESGGDQAGDPDQDGPGDAERGQDVLGRRHGGHGPQQAVSSARAPRRRAATRAAKATSVRPRTSRWRRRHRRGRRQPGVDEDEAATQRGEREGDPGDPPLEHRLDVRLAEHRPPTGEEARAGSRQEGALVAQHALHHRGAHAARAATAYPARTSVRRRRSEQDVERAPSWTPTRAVPAGPPGRGCTCSAVRAPGRHHRRGRRPTGRRRDRRGERDDHAEPGPEPVVVVRGPQCGGEQHGAASHR